MLAALSIYRFTKVGGPMFIRVLLAVLIISGVAVGHSAQSIAQVAGMCGGYGKSNKCQALWNRQQQRCMCVNGGGR
jgi:hypothetical protein